MVRLSTALLGLVLITSLALVSCAGSSTAKTVETAREEIDRPYSIRSGEFSYTSPLGSHNAYLCRPQSDRPLPAVVLIHEWWGLNEYVKLEAERLARQGFVTLAVDLYGGEVASDRERAAALKGAVDDGEAVQTMRSAVTFLRSLPETMGQPIGSMGWCFGGTKSLQLAIADPRIEACVVYYGSPVTQPGELKTIRASVLGIFGEEDASIPMGVVEAFSDGLALAGVPHQIEVFPGLGHAFANPSNVSGYAPKPAEEARRISDAFLKAKLK